MGYYPGVQTATPTNSGSSSSGGGGGGSSSSGPTIIRSEEQEKTAKRFHTETGSSYGYKEPSPKDTSFKAPSEQFKTGGGAALVSSSMSPTVTRAEFQQSLARRQEVSRAARSYAAQTKKTVLTSPKRRLQEQPQSKDSTVFQTYKVSGGRVQDTGKVSMAPAASGEKPSMSQTFLQTITPPKKEGEGKIVTTGPLEVKQPSFTERTIARLPSKYQPLAKEIAGAARTGVNLVGYMVGEPFRATGKLIQPVGDYIQKKEDAYYKSLEPGLEKDIVTAVRTDIKLGGYFAIAPFSFASRFIQTGVKKVVPTFEVSSISPNVLGSTGGAIKETGASSESNGTFYVKKPVTALGTTFLFAGITAGLSIVGTGYEAVSNRVIQKVVPTSIYSKTGSILKGIGTVASIGLAAGYATSIDYRVSSSKEPGKKFGEIVAGEIIPMQLGTRIGLYGVTKARQAGTIIKRKLFGKYVPISELTPQEVLTGKKTFPSTSKPSTAIKYFKRGDYTLTYPVERKIYGRYDKRSLWNKMFGKEYDLLSPTEVSKAYVRGNVGYGFDNVVLKKSLYSGFSSSYGGFKSSEYFTFKQNLGISYSKSKPYLPIYLPKFYPHATASSFPSVGFEVQYGDPKRWNEAVGQFYSGRGISTYFLRIDTQAPYNYEPGTFFPDIASPQGIYTNPTNIKTLPKGLKTYYGGPQKLYTYTTSSGSKIDISKAGLYVANQPKGQFTVPGVKREVEALLTPETAVTFTYKGYYSKFKGQSFPINLGVAKSSDVPSLRGSYYPLEELAVRGQAVKIPKSYVSLAVSTPGSSYLTALAIGSSKSSIPESPMVSSFASSISKPSSAPYSKPYIPSSVKSITSYKVSLPSSINSSLGSSRGSSYRPPSNITSSSYSYIRSPPSRTTYFPPSRPPTITFDFESPFTGQKKKEKLMSLRQFRSQASIVGIVKGVKAPKRMKRLTGLEIRGLPAI